MPIDFKEQEVKEAIQFVLEEADDEVECDEKINYIELEGRVIKLRDAKILTERVRYALACDDCLQQFINISDIVDGKFKIYFVDTSYGLQISCYPFGNYEIETALLFNDCLDTEQMYISRREKNSDIDDTFGHRGGLFEHATIKNLVDEIKNIIDKTHKINKISLF
jgi:hypothetical protein